MTKNSYNQRKWFNPPAKLRVLPFRFNGSDTIWREYFVPSWSRQTDNDEADFRAKFTGFVLFFPVEEYNPITEVRQ